MNKPGKRILPVFWLWLISIPGFAEIELTPDEWQLGIIDPDITVTRRIEIKNGGSSPELISFMSTCGCLFVYPQKLYLEPGATDVFSLEFDSYDDRGDFEKILIIRTPEPSGSKAFFRISGFVKDSVIGTETEEIKTIFPGGKFFSENNDFTFSYFYSPACRECREFLEREIPELSKKYGRNINVDKNDIMDSLVYEKMQEVLDSLGVTFRRLPLIIAGTTVLQGDGEIEEGLENLINAPEEQKSQKISLQNEHDTSKNNFLIVSVILAGLLDGINPCAFTTLIFLFSALAVAGKSRREILTIGLFFTVSVYVTYYLLGLGFFRILILANSFNFISLLIRWILFGVLLIFSVISFLDYYKIRKGRSGEILLQLPMSMKKKIHSSIRTYTRSTALAGSSIILGFLVSIFELGCTGQIYFPTITYMIQKGEDSRGYFLLALYNLAFIIPLAIVFIITFRGVGSEKVAGLFRTHLDKVKLFTAFLFLILAVSTLLF